jgi:DNA-binding PadR family transcriptional regulator
MRAKSAQLTKLTPRVGRQVPLLDDAPLGHLQALILKKMDELGRDAFGFNVVEQLSIESGAWIDHSQVYTTIRRFLDREAPLVELIETRPQPGAPPLKIYKLTAAGRAALRATAEHYQAVAERLNDKRKAARKI